MEDHPGNVDGADNGRRSFIRNAGVGAGIAFAGIGGLLADASAKDKPSTEAGLDPRTTAIVLIEYQNDFTSKGGVFHDAVKGVMQSNNMLPNTVKVVEKARAAGVTIMHAAITFADGYGELTAQPYGILKGVVDNKAFRKGSWGAAIVDDLKPQPGDILVEGKRGLDTFASTNLDFILRSKGIKTVVLGGFLTNCCVESTMRTAYEHGFDVITLKDCTATLSQQAQDAALAHTFGMFSHPMNHDQFLQRISSATA